VGNTVWHHTPPQQCEILVSQVIPFSTTIICMGSEWHALKGGEPCLHYDLSLLASCPTFFKFRSGFLSAGMHLVPLKQQTIVTLGDPYQDKVQCPQLSQNWYLYMYIDGG